MTPVNVIRRFNSIDRLYKENSFLRLQTAHVIVIGLGGVGSWCVESLARAGIGNITIMDLDHIAESNINRQIHALTTTLGFAKTEIMQRRIHEINPDCQITIIDDFLSPQNIDSYFNKLHPCSWIIDAIDHVNTKAALIAWAKEHHRHLITTGGAGGKTQAQQLKIADLSQTEYDPLSARVKYILRKQYHFPRAPRKFGIPCVYSNEPIRLQSQQQTGRLNCAGYGSIMTVTASMGLFAANYVINAILA